MDQGVIYIETEQEIRRIAVTDSLLKEHVSKSSSSSHLVIGDHSKHE